MLSSNTAPTVAARRVDPVGPRQRLPWLFTPGVWLRDLLRRQWRVERRGMNLHFVLVPAPVPEAEPAARENGSGRVLRSAFRDLVTLIDANTHVPRRVASLDVVRKALKSHGSKAIPSLPLTVLHRGLAELNALAPKGASEGLDELRRRMGLAIESRTREPVVASRARVAAPIRDVDVSEASHSLFEEMERSWTGQIPQGN